MWSAVGVLLALIGAAWNSVVIVQALSPRLYGVNYSLKKGPDWDPNRCKNRDQVAADLRQLKNEVTDRVRLFSMSDCDTAAIVLSLAPDLGLQVWLGLWVGEDPVIFNDERQRLFDLLSDDSYDFGIVLGIHVSSEAIYRGEITAAQAVQLRNVVRADVDEAGWESIPVTVCDIIDTNLVNPELTRLDSRVTTFNQFPFWERTVNITNAAEYMSYRVAMIEAQNTDVNRQIIITETGWADAGSNEDANVADPASMAKWMRDFVCLANSRNWQYFWFDAYDTDWRRIQDNLPNDVEGHFGTWLWTRRERRPR
jgi:glucan 1,3-beta-glucosidase